MVFGRSILPGRARPMVLELPSYKLPSLTNALLTAREQGLAFLRTAGTVIMAICVVMWWLSAFPNTGPPAGRGAPARRSGRARRVDAGIRGSDGTGRRPRGAAPAGQQLRREARAGRAAAVCAARLRLAVEHGCAHEFPGARGVRIDDVGPDRRVERLARRGRRDPADPRSGPARTVRRCSRRPRRRACWCSSCSPCSACRRSPSPGARPEASSGRRCNSAT